MCIINVELARCGEEQLEFLLSSARNYNLRQSTENKIYIRFLRNNQYFSFVYKSIRVLFFGQILLDWPSVHQILVKAPVKLLILAVPF